jgi:hypothetical protein
MMPNRRDIANMENNEISLRDDEIANLETELRELMGFPKGDTESLGGIMLKQRYDSFNPLAQTPEGYFQCFGPGGVVKKMREIGWFLDYGESPENEYGSIAFFTKRNPEIKSKPVYFEIYPNRAVCLAAVEALT